MIESDANAKETNDLDLMDDTRELKILQLNDNKPFGISEMSDRDFRTSIQFTFLSVSFLISFSISPWKSIN